MKFESYSQMFLLITAQFSQINIENIEKLLDNVLKIHLLLKKNINYKSYAQCSKPIPDKEMSLIL